jgi:hypothetical protein
MATKTKTKPEQDKPDEMIDERAPGLKCAEASLSDRLDDAMGLLPVVGEYLTCLEEALSGGGSNTGPEHAAPAGIMAQASCIVNGLYEIRDRVMRINEQVGAE